MDHYLTREEFDPIVFNGKRSEILPLDGDVEVGSLIRFREVDPEVAILTGRWIVVRLTWLRPIARGRSALVSFVPIEQGIDRSRFVATQASAA